MKQYSFCETEKVSVLVAPLLASLGQACYVRIIGFK